MTKSMEKLRAGEDLQAEIKAAFSDRIYSGPITDVDGDPQVELDEEQALYRTLCGKRWSEIPSSFIEHYPTCHELLTDEAFIAFLPAWLTTALRHEEVLELLVYAFSPNEPDAPMERTDRRLMRLNLPQRKVVRNFLAYSAAFDLSATVRERAQRALAHIADLMLG